MTRQQQAVLTPIVFFDCFDRPILKSYLRRMVYRQPITDQQLEEELRSLNKVVRQSQDFLYLADRKGLIENAKLRRQISLDFWQEAKNVIGKLAVVPFVRMIAVINSLSFWNVRPSSDIDLLIVTEPGFLPIARDHINVILTVLGKRNNRPPKAKKIAVDVLLTSDNLNVLAFRNEKDIYFDFWANHLTPVFDQANYYDQFLTDNPWIKETFPNFVKQSNHKINFSYRRQRVKRGWEKFYLTKPGQLINDRLARYQLARLRRYQNLVKDKGAVEVGEKMMRFNIPDRRLEYQKLFEERWQEIEAGLNV